MLSKGKKLISMLLCFAMVFSSMPLMSYAATPEAKAILCFLKETDDGFEEMTTAEVNALTYGSSFYLGVEAKDWNKISTLASDGMESVAFSIDYRSDIFTIDSSHATSKKWANALADRSFLSDCGDGYKFTNGNRTRDMSSDNPHYGDGKWSQLYLVAVTENEEAQYDWTGDPSKGKYLFVVEIDITENTNVTLPDDETVIEYARVKGVQTLGTHNASYEYNSNNAREVMEEIVEFDDSAMDDIFPAQFTVTYNANGGSFAEGVETAQKVNENASLQDMGLDVLAAPANAPEGTLFGGWYTSQIENNGHLAEATEFTKETKVIENTTVYAYWISDYTITFDGNGGKWGENGTLEKSAGVDQLIDTADWQDPVKSTVVGDETYNYEVVGWNSKADGTGDSYADVAEVADKLKNTNSTVYAIWSLDDEAMADAIKVVFHPNGGKIGDKEVNATEEVVVLPGEVLAEDYSDTTTREGYTFDTTNSWNTAMNGQNGTVVKNGTTITAAMATKVENAATGEPGYKLDVYAQWIATNGYTVEFYTDKDANDTNPYYTTTVAKETKLTEANIPNDPTRDDVNKDFNFWSTVKSGDGEQTKFDVENTAITADLVTDDTLKLYAVWKDKSHKITLDPGLGSFADGAAFELDKQVGDKFATADFAAAEAALVVPTASDSVNATYTFSYWATGANGSGKITYEDENCTVTADMTKLYAIYNVEGEDVVEVRFDKNGGTTGPDPEVIKVPKGSTLKDAGGLPEEPTRDGYDFAGWYDTQFPTDSDQPVTDDTVVRDGMTVYAKWTPKDTENAIKVNFHHNDGTDTVESITIASDGKLTITIEDPERTGYTALRWESDDDDLTIKSECADGKAVFNDVDITSVVTGEAPNRQADFYLVWSTDVQIDTTGTTLSVEYNTKAQAYTGYKVVDGAGVEVPTDVAGKVVLYYKSAAMDAPSADAQTNAATYELSAAWNETLTPDKHGVVYGETISIEPEDEFEITPVTLTLNVVGGPDAQQQKANKDGNKLTFEIANDDLNEDVKAETTLSEENTAFKIESTYYTVGEDTLTAFEAGQFPTTKGDYAVLPSVGGTAKGNYAICLGEFVEKYDTLPNELNVDKYAKLVVENGIELLNLRLNKSADEGWEAVSLFGNEADVAAGTVVTFAAEVKDYYAQIPFGKDTQFKLTGELPDEGVSVTLNGTEIKLAEKAIYDEFSKTYTFDTKTLGQALIGTKNGSFDNSLVVKLGAGDDAITYTLHIRQLVEAKITLNPGNSPYGLIERMADWDDDKKAAARAAFDEGNKFSSANAGLVPDGALEGVYYAPQAWADVNYDQDSTVQIVYNLEAFLDAGFKVIDSYGNSVDETDVTRSITLNRMGASKIDAVETTKLISTTVEFKPENKGDKMSFKTSDVAADVFYVAPGVYTMEYYIDGEDDEKVKVGERKIVVLWSVGDINLTTTINQNDIDDLQDMVAGRSDLYTEAMSEEFKNLHFYRISDVYPSGTRNQNDIDELKENVAKNKSTEYYSSIE